MKIFLFQAKSDVIQSINNIGAVFMVLFNISVSLTRAVDYAFYSKRPCRRFGNFDIFVFHTAGVLGVYIVAQ